MFILSYQFSFIAMCIHVSMRFPWDNVSEEMEITYQLEESLQATCKLMS